MNPLIAKHQLLNREDGLVTTESAAAALREKHGPRSAAELSDILRAELAGQVEAFKREHGNNLEMKSTIDAFEKMATASTPEIREILIGLSEAKIKDAENEMKEVSEALAMAEEALTWIPPGDAARVKVEDGAQWMRDYLEYQKYLVVEETAVIAHIERLFSSCSPTDADDDDGIVALS